MVKTQFVDWRECTIFITLCRKVIMTENTVIPPLIVHIIYRLDTGGLENGLVNLINNMPTEKYRHTIICLTDFTAFRDRIKRKDVRVYALHKSAGIGLRTYIKLWWLLINIKPDIVHTRNIGTIDCSVIAMLAGVTRRVHSEHGREGKDSDGHYARYNKLRRFVAARLHSYIALSQDLEKWLLNTVGVSKQTVVQVYNGVDNVKFYPNKSSNITEIKKWRVDNKAVVVGTVGRMAVIKDQITMALALVEASKRLKDSKTKLYGVMIGDGVLRQKIEKIFTEANLENIIWLPGNRNDIVELLNSFDIFILPSLNEGISNTILEAMSCGLPIIATRVGGNPELVHDNKNGLLVAPKSPSTLADAIERYVREPELIERHGKQSRTYIEQHFGMSNMINAYIAVYNSTFTCSKNE